MFNVMRACNIVIQAISNLYIYNITTEERITEKWTKVCTTVVAARCLKQSTKIISVEISPTVNFELTETINQYLNQK